MTRLDKVLARLGRPHSFRYAMIRGALPSCLVYLTYSGVPIRPLISATSENQLFAGARQRLPQTISHRPTPTVFALDATQGCRSAAAAPP